MSSEFRSAYTLASRLTLWNAFIYIVFFGSAFALFYAGISAVMHEDFDADLRADIEQFRVMLAHDGWQSVTREIDREVLEEGPENIYFRISDSAGRVLHASDLSRWRDLPVVTTLSGLGYTEGALLPITAPDDDYTARVAVGRIADDRVLEIGESTEELNDFLELLMMTFAATFTLVVVFASVAGWFLVRHAMSGVVAVTDAALDVTGGALNRRVAVAARGSEIERLADTFNTMLERIDTLISGMREMTDNVAHDLRSPLARIRANAEMALASAETVDEYRDATADTLEECDRLMHLINATLDVAEVEAGIARLDMRAVDISKVAEEACELFAPIAEDNSICLRAEIESGCLVSGNLPLLQRMLSNLLDNALKYSESKAEVLVKVQSGDNFVCVSVCDTGIGIGIENQARIFDRFFRCDQSRSRSGCGLGLSLVRAVASAHGGRVVVTSTPDVGSEFSVTLPV